jgi:hypothetical protein
MANKKVSASLVVLREIRDELKRTNARLDHMDGRLGEVTEQVVDMRRYIPEVEVRLATAITAMAGTLGDVRDRLARAEDQGKRLDAFEQRLEALERKTG